MGGDTVSDSMAGRRCEAHGGDSLSRRPSSLSILEQCFRSVDTHWTARIWQAADYLRVPGRTIWTVACFFDKGQLLRNCHDTASVSSARGSSHAALRNLCHR